MATRSNIGKRLPNGEIKAIYCHWDGYPEHNGKILVEHYTDEKKIDALLALGALSILGKEIGRKQDFNKPVQGWCLAYARDRGEEHMGGMIVDDVRDLTNTVDFVYIWENGAWACYNDEQVIDLRYSKPNWCNNNVTFTHSDAAQIQRIVKAYNEDRLIREFMPVPEELADTQAPNDVNPQEMLEKYGAENWYDWCVENWGTKWDISSVDSAEADGNSVSLYFDTAWSPPIAFYRFMEEQGFTVEAYYYEPGIAFCGMYRDGEDAEFVIPDTAAEAAGQIPSEIDEMFAISENMAVWEEESKEDV